MIETLFIVMLVITVLFFILTVIWQSLALGIVDTILWLVLAISVYNYEIPYTAIQNDNTIVTGVQVIESLYPYSWLFIVMMFITMLYTFVDIIFPMLQGRFSRMM